MKKSKFLTDFKKFATKGNIIDLAVAMLMGTSFGKIVTSLVNDVIMPIISFITGGASIKDLKWVITPASNENGVVIAESALRYGAFLQAMIDFIIIAFFMFLALRILMNAKLNLEKLEDMTSKEVRKLRKELKSQGKTRAEIDVILQKQADDKAAAAVAAANLALEEAEKAKPESQEKILADIRELLKSNQGVKNNIENLQE